MSKTYMIQQESYWNKELVFDKDENVNVLNELYAGYNKNYIHILPNDIFNLIIKELSYEVHETQTFTNVQYDQIKRYIWKFQDKQIFVIELFYNDTKSELLFVKRYEYEIKVLYFRDYDYICDKQQKLFVLCQLNKYFMTMDIVIIYWGSSLYFDKKEILHPDFIHITPLFKQ